MLDTSCLDPSSDEPVEVSLSTPLITLHQPKIRWRLQSSVPRSLETLFGGAQRIARNVFDATDGNFQIEPFAADEIVQTTQIARAISTGSIECGHTFSSHHGAGEPTSAFGTALPFGLNPRQTAAWLLHGEGSKLLNEIYERHNIYSIPSGAAGVQLGAWFRNKIIAPEDLAGVNFRISGVGARILSRLGATPHDIPTSGISKALEMGTIDAVESISPYDDERLGFQKIAPYFYYPAWWDPGKTFSLMINLDHWRRLPRSYKSVLTQACSEAGEWMRAKYDALNPAALRRMIAEGAILRAFPPEVMKSALAATDTFYAGIAETSPDYRKLFHAYRKLLWWQAAEYPYDMLIQEMRTRP